ARGGSSVVYASSSPSSRSDQGSATVVTETVCRSAGRDRDGDALDGVVRVAADVPDRLERLDVARGVRRSAAEDEAAARHRIPLRRPAAPGPPRADVVLEFRVEPVLTVVPAHLDAFDLAVARPGAAFEQARPRAQDALARVE